MAKSNLFRHVLSSEVRAHYLGENWESYVFIALDANDMGEMAEWVVLNLLLEKLTEACGRLTAGGDLVAPLEQFQGDAHSRNNQQHRRLAQNIKTVLDESAGHLVVLFDQFDAVYKNLDARFFANLRAIRDDHKYRISYLMFTREHLSRLHHSQENEEFEELFSANVIGLRPYAKDDALLMVERVSNRYGRQFPASTSEQLISLSGGHPGLLKAVCMVLVKKETDLTNDEGCSVDALLMANDVRSECDKLWNSISADEQNFLRGLAISGASRHQETEAARLLHMKGLIRNQNGEVVVFAPIFTKYVSEWKLTDPPSTRIHAGSLRIDTAGEVWVDEEQVIPTLSKKELRLLEYLCLEPGRLRTRDEIIAIVYPDEYRSGESITDDALNALVKRLRDRLERFARIRGAIITVRGKGYRLDTIGKS
jgi:DNA-binding winged helix-turn-helix (wHTH) protein